MGMPGMRIGTAAPLYLIFGFEIKGAFGDHHVLFGEAFYKGKTGGIGFDHLHRPEKKPVGLDHENTIHTGYFHQGGDGNGEVLFFDLFLQLVLLPLSKVLKYLLLFL